MPPRARSPSSCSRSSSSGCDSIDEEGIRSASRLFSPNERYMLKSSLRKKLLAYEGEGLARLEGRLHAADKKNRGELDSKTFKGCVRVRDHRGALVSKEEAVLLTEKLRNTRSGRIRYRKVREVIEGRDAIAPRRGRSGGDGKPPAGWAVRHGSVGGWLKDVASPMERKLFYDFIEVISGFETVNGLDHHRGSCDDKDGGTTIS
ncbi:unnamed protein product, partial [Chrysoparadoxa australica]